VKDISEKILNYLIKSFWTQPKTKKGLYSLFSIEAILIILLPLNKLKSILIVPEKYLPIISKIEPFFKYPAWSKIILFILLCILTWIIWLFKSGRIKQIKKNKGKFNIRIALECEDIVSKSILRKTLKKVNRKLDSLKLLDRFIIKEIGSDIFSDNAGAQAYNKKKDINLTIHGDVSTETRNAKRIFSLKDFSFSYRYHYNPANPNLQKVIKNDIDLMLTHRNWIIEEDNTSEGLEKISDNFVEILLSVVAISIISKREYFDVALELIEHVLPFMESKIHNRKVVIDIKKKRAKIPIDILRTGRLKAILINSYSFIADEKVKEKDYKTALEITQKSFNIGADKFFSYIRLAYCSFLTNDLEQAKKYTKKMNYIKPNSPQYFVNMAFFAILENNHEEAIKYYSHIKTEGQNSELIGNVINFLKEQKEKLNKQGLDYGIAYLTYVIDKQEGTKLFKEFADKTNIPSYKNVVCKILSINTQKNNIKKKRKNKKRRKRRR